MPLSSHVETLESRQLLSASAQIVDGTLEITGSDRKDVILMSIEHGDPQTLDVRVNGERYTFAVADVSTVEVDALGGNDRIDVNEKNGAVYPNMVVNGGEGNDTIITGSGNDIVDGGAGNDVITGGAGDDYLTGDDGNDKLVGGDDNDMIDAGAGRDRLQGGDGDDNLDGGAGKDAIQSGAGANSIATDQSNPNEVRGKPRDNNSRYIVTSLDDAPAQLAQVAESAVPGARVIRVEKADLNYAIYYRFGTDPEVYKAVVEILDDGDVELIGRELSLQEARPSAMQAFDTDVPNQGVLSIFQKGQGHFDIRFRDMDGQVQTTETQTIDWGLDDASEDADNDGRYDPHENGNGGGGDQNQGGGDGSLNQGGDGSQQNGQTTNPDQNQGGLQTP